ncbi:IpaD/SipD/SspD family type III secretion system needle tip protein [Enterobacter ludwigii]|jgi:invasin D
MVAPINTPHRVETGLAPQEKQGIVAEQLVPFYGEDILKAWSQDKGQYPYPFAEKLLYSNPHLLKSDDKNKGHHIGATKSDNAGNSFELMSRLLDYEQKARDKSVRDALADARIEREQSVSIAARNPSARTPAHIGSLEDMINNIHSKYQKTYADINKAAAEAMKEINAALGRLHEFMKPGSDGKVEFDRDGFLSAWKKVRNEYGVVQNDSNFGQPTLAIHSFTGSVEEYNFWKGKLDSPFVVRKNGPRIEIYIDGGMLDKITATIANTQSGEIHSAIFNTLQQAIDSHKNGFNNGVSQLLERFRQDNSVFDSLIQLLTQVTSDLHRYNLSYMN